MKVYIKLACVLAIGALWRTTANMAFCYLFWITTLAWGVRYIVRAKAKGGLFVLLGITCNALVTSLNKGVMPSVGIPAAFHPAAPIWNVSGKGQWLTLADQAAFYRFSIGDMFLIAGVLMFLIEKCAVLFRLPSSVSQVRLPVTASSTVVCGHATRESRSTSGTTNRNGRRTKRRLGRPEPSESCHASR